MSYLHIFAKLDHAVDECIAAQPTHPTHLLLGHTEIDALHKAFRALGTEFTTSNAMHRGLRIISVDTATLIQLGTLCAPYRDPLD